MKISNKFTEREKEVIKLLLQGKSNKQIALSLRISKSTVEFHLKNIFKRIMRIDHVAARCVDDAFGFACRARRVENEQFVFTVHDGCGAMR